MGAATPIDDEQPPAAAAAATDVDAAAQYEDEHVHRVYEQIAGHFSQTRYKPWPVVDRFLHERRPGSVGLDVGCGNGKYLTVRRDVFIIASDRSRPLVSIAAQHLPHAAIIADALHLPHASHAFDFALCIAVVHHLSTRARRVDVIRELLRLLRPGAGQALIFAWALEQRSSRRGWDRGQPQDVLVPWVLTPQQAAPEAKRRRAARQQRSDQQDGRADINHADSAGADQQPDQAHQQRQRQRASQPGGQDDDVQAQAPPSAPPAPAPAPAASTATTFQRYYHLYAQGELQGEVAEAGGTVVDAGYDRDNWWVVAAAPS